MADADLKTEVTAFRAWFRRAPLLVKVVVLAAIPVLLVTSFLLVLRNRYRYWRISGRKDVHVVYHGDQQ